MKKIESKNVIPALPSSADKASYPYALSAPIFNTDQLFLSMESVRPGTRASAAHYHEMKEEIVYVAQGELVAVEGDVETVLQEGDFALFESDSKRFHYLENRTDFEARFLIFKQSSKIRDVVFTKNEDLNA